MKKYLLLSIFALLHGCAFTTEVVDIPYSPQSGVIVVQGADVVNVGVSVTDSRQDRSKVSSKKNGYGMETAPILSRRDVPSIVVEIIEQELVSRGFKIGSGAPSVLVKTDVRRFYNDHKLGFFAGDAVADFEFTVEVKSPSGANLYSRGIVAHGTEENTQLATGNNAALALGKAISHGMSQLFSDPMFVSALKAGGIQAELAKTKEQMLDELARDKSISYEEYLRRQKVILRR